VANFLKNINCICLKFVVFTLHTLIHLWYKFHSQQVHGLGYINKSISTLFMEKCLIHEIFLCEKESPQSEIFLPDFGVITSSGECYSFTFVFCLFFSLGFGVMSFTSV
jgi:hypothetical protein